MLLGSLARVGPDGGGTSLATVLSTKSSLCGPMQMDGWPWLVHRSKVSQRQTSSGRNKRIMRLLSQQRSASHDKVWVFSV